MSQYRNLYIEQGESWEMFVFVTDTQGRPLDLSDFSVTMAMKKSYTAIQKIHFNTRITDPIKGEIKIWLDETETAFIKPLRYVYDCNISGGLSTPNPVAIRFMEGIVTVSPSASL